MPGTVLAVHNDDPAARESIPAWCRAEGHELASVIRHDELSTTFVVRVARGA
jgi:TusA-related sulfurtransferase